MAFPAIRFVIAGLNILPEGEARFICLVACNIDASDRIRSTNDAAPGRPSRSVRATERESSN